MSIQHENEFSIPATNGNNVQPAHQSDLPSDTQKLKASNRQPVARAWHFLSHWLAMSTFAPSWLPRSLRHPAIGYLVAIVLEVVAVLTTIEILQLLPTYAFPTLL